MREQHLSDEAIAAFADDVLRGHARDRASRHTAACAECKYAVLVQREAVWALRAAPAPSLPSGLLDRLRDVAETTPITPITTSLDADGAPVFASFGSAAALAPDVNESRRSHALRPFVLTTAAVAVASALAVSSGGYLSDGHGGTAPVPANPVRAVSPAQHDTARQPVELAHLLGSVRSR